MPQSDSEDFESADEGQTNTERKDRKKRNSSSNYSDNLDNNLVSGLEKFKSSDADTSKNVTTDGWDDFEIEETEDKTIDNLPKESARKDESSVSEKKNTEDTGWDDFDDWGQSEPSKSQEVKSSQQSQNKPDPQIQEVTERLAAASTKSDGWGWGWGVDTILSTATAGITTITSQVSQGISTVLETGIGAPDPEELARSTVKESESVPKSEIKTETKPEDSGETAFPAFGSLFSSVTKFVETTGTKVIAGGLDTLETIGKKTMDVLQDGDPGLAKKRAMLGLDSGDKPVLSQILREAKEKADEEDKIREAKREAKEVHYETLFDDYEGLVNLEALEMLSRQVSMRINERISNADPQKKQNIKETLQQIAELCEMPDDESDEDDDEEHPEDMSKEDMFHERLQRATRDIGLKMQFQPVLKHYAETLANLETIGGVATASGDVACSDSSTASGGGARAAYKLAVASMARWAALSVQLLLKTAEMLLVKPRRSTADEADAMAQLTAVLKKHVSELATLFTEKLSKFPDDNKVVNAYITNVFLEAENSAKYIENAFQLTLPIIQIGAI